MGIDILIGCVYLKAKRSGGFISESKDEEFTNVSFDLIMGN